MAYTLKVMAVCARSQLKLAGREVKINLKTCTRIGDTCQRLQVVKFIASLSFKWDTGYRSCAQISVDGVVVVVVGGGDGGRCTNSG